MGHLLVVDDEPGVRHIVTRALAAEGFCVEAAENGAEALRAIERSLPQLVLLDLQMPVLDGAGFAQALRERGVTLPIVVMSGTMGAEQLAVEMRATRCLAKPFTLRELRAALHEALAAQ